jgi:hypothetical protein
MLGFIHPITQAYSEFTIAAPADFNAVRHILVNGMTKPMGRVDYSESPEICWSRWSRWTRK